MGELPVLRIFVSSPADVRPERQIAKRAIDRLAREYSYHLRIEGVLWEREPLTAAHHFQDIENLPAPRSCDIVLVILWSRLGVALAETRFKGPLSGRTVTGTEWEFEDALAGVREKGLPDLLLYRKTAEVIANLSDRAALEERLKQQELVEEFLQRWFRSADTRSFTAAFHEFAAPDAFEEAVTTHLRALVRRRLEAIPAIAGEPVPAMRYAGAPFRGLLSFEPEHAPIFFGRGKARHELRELLARQVSRGTGFVLVLGASGSGKSSLVKAGLLPDLKLSGMLGRVALCRHAVLRPSDTEGDPVAALARALFADTALPELVGLSWTAEAMRALLTDAPAQAATAIRQGLDAAAKLAGLTERAEARLALVVDQLEELFTQEKLGQEVRAAFVRAIEVLARSGLVWVIATMRGDFFDRLATIPTLAELSKGEARYLLAPPGEQEIGQMIAGPAREAGCRFETTADGTGLDETIRAAAGGDPGALPLLSFLLDQLWRARNADGTLTYAAYTALGGLQGALGRRAEEAFAAEPPEVQAALPRMLRALVTIGHRPAAGGEPASPTARTAALDRFAVGTAERRLVEAFLRPDARLLIADGGDGRDNAGGQVRIAHEALLTHWPRARDHIAHDRADIELRALLEQSERIWRAAPVKDRSSLLLPDGLPLSQAIDLLERRGDEIEPATRAFVRLSRTTRGRHRLVRLASMALALVIAGVGIAYGYHSAKTIRIIDQRREAAAAAELAGTMTAYAGSSGETVLDGPIGGHGLYTEALLKYLDRPDLSATEAVLAAHAYVREAAAKVKFKQTPQLQTSLNADVFLRELPQQRKARAFVVGVKSYQKLPLENPVNDAEAIARLLRAQGYAVDLLTDVDLAALTAAAGRFIGRFASEADAGAGLRHRQVAAISIDRREAPPALESPPAPMRPMPNTVAIVYFAGVGVEVDGRSRFAAVDSKTTDATRDDVQWHWFDVSDFVSRLEQHVAARLVVLDFCRDDPFGKR